jgi:hypothetical protein
MSVNDQIWQELYEADRLMRYFGRVSSKFSKYHAWVTYTTVLSLLSAAIPLMVIDIPTIVAGLLFLFVGALVITTMFWDFSAKATSARIAAAAYSHLSQELQALWFNGASQSQIDMLRQIKITIANSTNINIDKAINNQTADEAYEYLCALGAREQSAPVV